MEKVESKKDKESTEKPKEGKEESEADDGESEKEEDDDEGFQLTSSLNTKRQPKQTTFCIIVCLVIANVCGNRPFQNQRQTSKASGLQPLFDHGKSGSTRHREFHCGSYDDSDSN